MSSSSQHLGALLPATGSALKVSSRPTPTTGPHELIIEVHAVALNPVDHKQRDFGFMLSEFPAVLGSDVAGVVHAAGSSAPADLKQGTRVAAFASAFFKGGAPNYGAFQQKVVVPAASVVPLPDRISFKEAALLPMSALTTWSGWYSIGLPRDTAFKPADKMGMLVWGGASSVGSGAVQVAKMMGFTVYATANERNSALVKGLGASRVFDYRSSDVVKQIVQAAKEDGLTLATGYDAAGQLDDIQKIISQTHGSKPGMVASAIPLTGEEPKVEDVEVKFVFPPTEPEAQTEHFSFVFNKWLKEKLEKGEFVPSPRMQVVGKGLDKVQVGLDELKGGLVSGAKLVVEL